MAVSAFHITGRSPLIERDDLAIDDRLVRHLRQALHDARVSDAEVVVVARTQMNVASGLNAIAL